MNRFPLEIFLWIDGPSPKLVEMEFATVPRSTASTTLLTRARRQTLLIVQAVIFLCNLAAFLVYIGRGWGGVASATSAAALLSVVSYLLADRGKQSPAVFLLAVELLGVATTLPLLSRGIYDSAMLIFPTSCFVVAVVAATRTTVVFSLLAWLAASFIAFNTWRGSNVDPLAMPENLIVLDSLVVLVILGFAGALASFVAYVQGNLLRSLGEQQADLEVQVAERTADLTKSNSDLHQALSTLDRAREDLVRNEKLVALGKLVAGVAHELNTPLGNATVLATSLQSDVQATVWAAKPGPVLDYAQAQVEGFDVLVRSLAKASNLVTNFKQIAVDRTSDRRRTFSLSEVLGDVQLSFRFEFKHYPWLLKIQAPCEVEVLGYPGALVQVLANLLQNAVVHGFEGRNEGCITVTTARMPAEQFSITVTDDGNGIEAPDLKRIFDPFFTTRVGQGGSGLGLTICHNLTTGVLGGRLAVESQPGKGTSFRLELPIIAPEAPSTFEPNAIGPT